MINWSEYEPDQRGEDAQKRTSAARVRLVILNAISAGALLAGTRVIETDLGAALHVSRTPLREALTSLRAEQVLVHDGEGLRVRTLSWRDVSDLYDMRGTLEGMAARLAAEQSSMAEKRVIAALCDEEQTLMEAGAAPHQLASHNRRFHQAILQSANNPFLSDALTKLSRLTILLGNTVYSMPTRRDLISQEHQDIKQAIWQGDGVQAEAMMRHHLAQALQARLHILSDVKGQELD